MSVFTFLPARLERAADPQAELMRLAEVGAHREFVEGLRRATTRRAGRPRDEALENAVAEVRQRTRLQGLTLREAAARFVVENHVADSPPEGRAALAAELVAQLRKTGGVGVVPELRSSALALWKAARR